MGKKWVSKKGNLFLTILFDMSKKNLDFKKFAVLNAYLLKSILVKKFSNKIKIKWPNDLLFEGKKICGILQETVINAENSLTDELNITLIDGDIIEKSNLNRQILFALNDVGEKKVKIAKNR